jgi:hypothetical protein
MNLGMSAGGATDHEIDVAGSRAGEENGPVAGDAGDKKETKAETEEADELDEGRTAPFGWVSIVVIVTLVVGTWFLIQKLSADSKLQDCVQSGRRNCAPIDDTGH